MWCRYQIIIVFILLLFSCADPIDLKIINNGNGQYCITDIRNEVWIDDLEINKFDSLNRIVGEIKISRLVDSEKYSDTICFDNNNRGYNYYSFGNYSFEKDFKYKITASNPGFEDIIFFKVDNKNNIRLIKD